MAPEPREKLLRVQSARSTTGCRTCKSRRVKCDEDRPWCQRCLKARVPCHYDAPQVPQVANKFIIFTVPRPLPENPDLVHSERRSLHYFRCRAALQLTAPFYSALWVEGIFQIAARHDFVMSALVALSSMHESFCQQGELRERYQATAIYHYTKAMGDIALISHFESSIYAVLVSSVIFYSIESLRGCFYPALQHIQSGVRIIGEQRQRLALDSSQPSQLAVSLERDFLGLQNQIMELGDSSKMRAYDTMQDFHVLLPEHFESIDDARYHIEVIYNEIHCVIDYYESLQECGGPLPGVLSTDIVPRYEGICNSFGQWNEGFAHLTASLSEDDARKSQAVLLLRIYQLLIKVTLDNIFSGDCFDGFDVDIARLLDLAEAFLQGEDQGLGESQYAFSLSLGIIPPLFMLAYRCSYAPLRDKSLELLASKRRREGVWDSGIALRLAQQAFTFKSQVAATGSNYNVQISNISFVSETTCQMDFVIVEPMAPSASWLPVENSIRGHTREEVIYIDIA